jgi:hypothetical protein
MDTYDEVLNNRTQPEIEEYVTHLEKVTSLFGFSIDRLKELYRRRGFNPQRLKPAERRMMERVNEIYAQVTKDSELMEQLLRLAKLRGSAKPEETVQLYVKMHAFDDLLLDRQFPRAVYVSFGNPKTQSEISYLPTLFYYQHKEPGKIGQFGVPWFTVKPH